MYFKEKPDILSSVLSRLKLETTVAGALDAGGDYAIDVGNYAGLKLYLILKGQFWLKIKGDDPRQIREGDCVLLPRGKSFQFSKHPDARTCIPLIELVSKSVNGVMTLNGGGEYLGIGIHFLFSGHFPQILFAQLPTLIHVASDNDQAIALRWNIERFREEYWSRSMGRTMVLDHLAPIILLQILRSHVAASQPEKDWLAALADPKLSLAIEAMHTDISRAWSLESLAKVSKMSRSGFAANFRKQVGLYPIEYLTHWRIHIACELLTDGTHSVSETAELVGYNSESAFSTTFTKVMNCRPGRYARKGRA